MALLHDFGQEAPLAIVDLSDPVKPRLACTLSPAQGGRFLSASKVAFWAADKLGTADLATGVVEQTAQLPVPASSGAMSADGTEFAYRVWGTAGGETTHLFKSGSDRTLYAQEPLGGHGGAGQDFGPFDQLQFSPDGKELLDYLTFRPNPGPPNLMVFRIDDGATLFQESGQAAGFWALSGSVLYFPVTNQLQQTGEMDSIDASGQRRTVATGLKGIFWPALTPDGTGVVYNAPDSSIPDCGGLPHVWRLDLRTGSASQLSKPVSAIPVFVGPNTFWSMEEKQVACNPLIGPSSPDGTILAHDVTTGSDAVVDTSFYLSLTSAAGYGLATTFVLDVRL